MEGMRDLMRGTLGRSLDSLSEVDRLAVAWPVVCGKVLAEHGTITGYGDGVVRIQVQDGTWLKQMMSMRGQLAGEMARIARVKVNEIHFEMTRNSGR
jgi:Dna[CI] antecedent, DciA